MRQALASSVVPAKRSPRQRPARRLGEYRELIDGWLLADLEAPRKQRHTAKRVWRRLVDEPALACALVVATRGECVLQAWAPVISVAGALVLYNVDKLLVARPRPAGHRLEMIGSASFPSGHATQATAFYVSLLLVCWTLVSRRVVRVTVAAAAMLLVAAIAASRVYLGVHYPSDVAAGALLGAVWAATVWALLVRPRAAPRATS